MEAVVVFELCFRLAEVLLIHALNCQFVIFVFVEFLMFLFRSAARFDLLWFISTIFVRRILAQYGITA